MQLTAHEVTLLEACRRLPSEVADELSALVRRLANLASNTRIDWSDSWSDADLRDFTAHAIKRLEAGEEKG